jgi:CheY-like chemotaxis protein
LLVVEDRETNRQLLLRLLEPLGFEIETAANGREALRVWERWQPHLVWIDMQMPYMDGYETTRRIKASPQGTDTLIIALTATAFEDDRHRAISAGCDDFLRKPFRQEEIFNALVEHLDVRFIYEQEPASPLAPKPTAAPSDYDVELAPIALQTLPPELVDELKIELIRADLSRIHQLLDQVRALDEPLGNGLANLVDNFEYDHLLALIDQTKSA